MMRSSKLESLVGLARRAGKVAAGTAAVEEALLKKKARLVLLANDVSPNTQEQIVRLAETVGVSVLKTGTKRAWGTLFQRKELGVLAILDVNFAKGILSVKE